MRTAQVLANNLFAKVKNTQPSTFGDKTIKRSAVKVQKLPLATVTGLNLAAADSRRSQILKKCGKSVNADTSQPNSSRVYEVTEPDMPFE